MKKCIVLILLANVFFSPATAQNKSSVERAMELMLNARFEEAIPLLQQTVENQPQNARAFSLLGQAYQSLQQLQLAEQAYQKALKLRPEDQGSRFALSLVQIRLGHLNAAQKDLEHLLKLQPEHKAAKIQLARIFFKKEQYGRALAIYEKLLKSEPQNASFYKQAARCALQLNRVKQAQKLFEKALQHNPRDIETSVLLFNLLKKNDQWEKCLNVINQAMVYAPQDKRLYLARGDVHLTLQKYLEAKEDYLKALSLGDSSAYLYKKLGVSYYYLNDFSGALFSLKRSVQLNQEDPLTHYFLGLTQKALNLPEKALISFKQTIELARPDYLTDVYLQMADSYSNLKQYQQALAAYKKVLEMNPERKIVLFYMAVLYDKYYKDRTVPLRYYQQFLEQASGDVGQRYKTYALERMKAIKEKLHFLKGKRGTRHEN